MSWPHHGGTSTPDSEAVGQDDYLDDRLTGTRRAGDHLGKTPSTEKLS